MGCSAQPARVRAWLTRLLQVSRVEWVIATQPAQLIYAHPESAWGSVAVSALSSSAPAATAPCWRGHYR